MAAIRQNLKASALAGSMLAGLCLQPACASEEAREYHIESADLASALNLFALQSGKDILFREGDLAGKSAPSLNGVYTPEEGLKILLAGSGATFKADDHGVVLVKRDVREVLTRTPIEEITVVGEHESDPALIDIDAAVLIEMPGALNDPLKGLLSLPGITFSNGDMSPPIVRGSGPNDNLFLIDGIPFTYIFHDTSFSIVDPNVIRTLDFHPGAAPAQYGMATGGVVDILLREPRDEFAAKIDLGMLISGVQVEMPITDNTAAYASYRQSFVHLFLSDDDLLGDFNQFKDPKNRDYAAKWIWRGGNAAVAVSAIGAKDSIDGPPLPGVPDVFGEDLARGFDAQSVSFRADLLGGSFDAVVSHMDQKDDSTYYNDWYKNLSIQQWALRTSYLREFGRHLVTVGANLRLQDAALDWTGAVELCNYMDTLCTLAVSWRPSKDEGNFDSGEIYLKDQISFGERLLVDVGLQYSDDRYLDVQAVDPKFVVTLAIADNLSAYFRAGRYRSRMPIERLLVLGETWGRQQEHEISNQFVIGQRWNISEKWRVQAEAYYKTFNVLDLSPTYLLSDIDGQAYGLDFLLSRPANNKLYGWLALSVGKSERTNKTIDQTSNYRFDAPFSGTLALTYKFDNGWSLGGRWSVQTGAAYNPVLSIGVSPSGLPRPVYGAPYSEHQKMYNSLNFRLEREREYSFGTLSFYVDVLNVFNNENPVAKRYSIRTFYRNSEGDLVLPVDSSARSTDSFGRFIGLGVSWSY